MASLSSWKNTLLVCCNSRNKLDPMKPDHLRFSTEQDCSSIIEQVKVERDAPVGKEWRKVAEIPMIFIDQSMREGWFNDREKWRQFLNNPDFKAFRIHGGRIGRIRQI